MQYYSVLCHAELRIGLVLSDLFLLQESKLVNSYNTKPMLAKPHVRYYMPPNKEYLEIDVDAHCHSYLGRKVGYVCS